MNLALEAFIDLYPEKVPEHTFFLAYSGKFRGYNANVKVRKDKRNTASMDLYNTFLKNIHMVIPKTENDSVLEDSFNRVNEKYFFGMLEKPNLAWGNNSFRKLGSYEYGTDTITISRILEPETELLDYVMHHEMLHKKLQYKSKNGRSVHHSPEFKRFEKKFENSALLEKKLQKLGQIKKRGYLSGLFRF